MTDKKATRAQFNEAYLEDLVSWSGRRWGVRRYTELAPNRFESLFRDLLRHVLDLKSEKGTLVFKLKKVEVPRSLGSHPRTMRQ